MERIYENLHMEKIYTNAESAKRVDLKPPTNESNLRNPRRRFHDRGYISLGLLSFCLLVLLLGLAVTYDNLRKHTWDIEVNLTERLTTSERKLSAMAAERDTVNSNLTRLSSELKRLRAASRQRRNCPDRWTRFGDSCYRIFTESLSWEKAKEFCIKEQADLVTITDAKEQSFVSEWTTKDTWIGLNDRQEENTWRWSKDASPLTLAFWSRKQPDNGGGSLVWGEEDCVHLEVNTKKWNDRRCDNTMDFICEK